MDIDKITVKETGNEDLQNVMELWNNGEVMFYVGFPNGLGTDLDNLFGNNKG